MAVTAARASIAPRVNDFLRNPDRRVGQFPLKESRRRHLDAYYTYKIGAEYMITTVSGSRPYVWLITKKGSPAQTLHKTWTRVKEETKRMIKVLVGTGHFREYVPGDLAAVIQSVDVLRVKAEMGRLQSGGGAVGGRQPLQEVAANAPSVAGTKRAADDDDVVGENSAKKAKSSTSTIGDQVRTRNRPVEIIDLT